MAADARSIAPRAGGQRIAKLLARAGLGSRREIERWIAAGRVALDGRPLEGPAVLVDDLAGVTVDGRPVASPAPTRLWRYHKPRGLVVSRRDERGRPTVFDHLPPGLPRVVSVGRLDLTSEGLLLLTNDGALARHLELPATGWIRRYRVRAFGTADPAALGRLAAGVTIAGVAYGPIEARLERQQGRNAWIAMALREGRNREVRRVIEHLGLEVNRLIRLAYGPFQLGELAPGEAKAVPRRVLEDQLGPGFRAGPTAAATARAERARHRRPA
ncbi:MAG: pseudouridine synthase [Alphaproteobacteria bacterium]